MNSRFIESQVLERQAQQLWKDDDLDAQGKKGFVALTELSRYDMVKSRLW